MSFGPEHGQIEAFKAVIESGTVTQRPSASEYPNSP